MPQSGNENVDLDNGEEEMDKVLMDEYTIFVENAADCSSVAGSSDEAPVVLEDLEEFAAYFKLRRLQLGLTQGDVGVALGRLYGNDFSQTTVSRFEALNLSFKNMCKLKRLLEKWLSDIEEAVENGTFNREFVRSQAPPADIAPATGVKRRKKRTNIEGNLRQVLEEVFKTNPRPSVETMQELSSTLDMDQTAVRIWFCNRRQKERRQHPGTQFPEESPGAVERFKSAVQGAGLVFESGNLSSAQKPSPSTAQKPSPPTSQEPPSTASPTNDYRPPLPVTSSHLKSLLPAPSMSRPPPLIPIASASSGMIPLASVSSSLARGTTLTSVALGPPPLQLQTNLIRLVLPLLNVQVQVRNGHVSSVPPCQKPMVKEEPRDAAEDREEEDAFSDTSSIHDGLTIDMDCSSEPHVDVSMVKEEVFDNE